MKKVQDNLEVSTRRINSKFGEIEINEANAVSFPHGILGFSEESSFCFINSNIEKFSSFVYMQSTKNDDLIFLVRPIDIANQELISDADIDVACEQLSMSRDNLAIVLIVSVRVLESGQRILVANVKAPIFIDSAANVARQFVFQNANYATQHVL